MPLGAEKPDELQGGGGWVVEACFSLLLLEFCYYHGKAQDNTLKQKSFLFSFR